MFRPETFTSEGFGEFAQALQNELDRTLDRFEMEYPCHGPEEQRWFAG